MPAHVASAFRTILLAVRAELAEFLEWHESRIHIVAGDTEVPYRTGDQDIVLRAGDERPDREAIDGGGRRNNKRMRSFEVEVRTRMVLDPTDEDLQRLTTASTGHMALEDRVCDCLEVWYPIDDGDNVLTSQALRLHGLSKARRDRGNPQWVTSTWDVEVLYRRDLDETREA